MQIIQKPSPNFSSRENYKPEIISVHVMAGTLIGTDYHFLNSTGDKAVSAHYGIGNTGEIHQYVKEENKAWANGKAMSPTFKLYKPNVNPNLYTISIENEGYDLKDAPETLISALVALLNDICERWAIPKDRDHIIGHYEINGVSRPNCPSADKTLLDKIVARLNPNIKTLEQKKADIIKLVQDL